MSWFFVRHWENLNYHQYNTYHKLLLLLLLLRATRHSDCCICWIRIDTAMCGPIVLVQFGFGTETFTASCTRIRLISRMQPKFKENWILLAIKESPWASQATSYAPPAFFSARIPFRKRCKSAAHDHGCVRDWPAEICAGMWHRNQSRRTDSMSRGTVNAWSNGSPGQNFHRIRRKRMAVRRHGIYCGWRGVVSMETIVHIPDRWMAVRGYGHVNA